MTCWLTSIVLLGLIITGIWISYQQAFGQLANGLFAKSSLVNQHNNYLVPFVFEPLPLGSIQPQGWILDQMQLMAEGLPGHLYDFYDYVAQSSWLGGSREYSVLNEAFPYWFNGIVPLAYQLNDERLKQQVHAAADYVISNQYEDGWIGPESKTTPRILWARFPACLGLIQLVEANSTYQSIVVPALYKFSELLLDMLQDDFEGYHYHKGSGIREILFQWGRVRYADMLITLQWLHEKHPRGNPVVLFEAMRLLHQGSFDWSKWYNEAEYIKDDLYQVPQEILKGKYHYQHAVNVGQGLKASAVIRRFTYNDTLVETAFRSVNWTFQYHGAASGTILGDERINGLSPWSGSELCTAVETMYSLSYLYHSLGNQYYAERCELAAFNALPVMLSPDHWAHQYVTQPNQPFSNYLDPSPFFNTNGWSQTYGLEPHYPCCTVNHHQGFPKYLSMSWVKIHGNDNAVGHALLGPSSINFNLKGGRVNILSKTSYPFSGKLHYYINSPAPFDLFIRIPSWALNSSYFQVGDSNKSSLLDPHATTGMQYIPITRKGITTITFDLKADINVSRRANDTVAIYHGPILYAIEIDAIINSMKPRDYRTGKKFPIGYAPENARDYIMTNATSWNLAIDPNTVAVHALSDDGERNQIPLFNPIFAPGAPPVWMTAEACKVKWPLLKGYNTPGPPIPLANRRCLGPAFSIKLVPYAGAKLHMAELPTVDLSPGSVHLYGLETLVDQRGRHS